MTQHSPHQVGCWTCGRISDVDEVDMVGNDPATTLPMYVCRDRDRCLKHKRLIARKIKKAFG